MVICSQSIYIVHPHTYRNILRYKNFTFCGVSYFLDFSLYVGIGEDYMKRFWSYSRVLSREEYDNSYVTDETTGETFPIYLEVPCGHCALCRKRKKSQLAFRAQAETNYWFSKGSPTPLFVTLTYNNTYLPYTDDGNPTLRASDVTLFLKRLRQNLVRRYGRDVAGKLRYILCGEYGSKTRRPHYHILFWNFPNLGSSDGTRNLVSCIHCIEDSWSTIVGYEKNPVTGVPEPLYQSLGWISCFEANTGASAYVAKYIGKTCKWITPDCEKPFVHRSCGSIGGIGSAWMKQWLQDNPGLDPLDYSSWVLTDPYTGAKICSGSLPSYYLEKCYPVNFKNKKVNSYLSRLEECVQCLAFLGFYKPELKEFDVIYSYCYIPPKVSFVFDKFDFSCRWTISSYANSLTYELQNLLTRFSLTRVRNYYWHIIDHIVSYLSDYEYDKRMINYNKNKRKAYFARLASKFDMDSDTLNYLKYTAERSEKLAELREKL